MKTFWRSPFLTLIILALDTTALALLWSGVYDLRAGLAGAEFFGRTIGLLNPKSNYSSALPILLAAWLVILAHFRFYAHHERIADLSNLRPIFWAVVWMLVVVAVYNVSRKSDFGRTVILGFAVATTLYLYVSRTVFRLLKRLAVEKGHGRVRVLVMGSGDLARETLARLHEHPDIGFRVVGFLTADGEDAPAEMEGYPALGSIDDAVRTIQRHRVEEVFFAIEDMDTNDLFRLVASIQNEAPAVCKVVANMLYVIVNRAKVDEVIGLPVIAFRGSQLSPAELFLKRLADILLAGLASLFLVLPGLLFAALIKLDSSGPVLFIHERVGHKGRRFRMLKFRTMRSDSEPYAEAPVDQRDTRVTRFGAFLRRTSLDEIPQLLNILKGDMSLVGPRPEMPFITDTYSDWQATRLDVQPGLTGLWQVAGRKNLPLHDNLEYDFFYVRNQSLGLDIEILLRTFPAVFLSRGAF
jgi:exopolysaccharide biosynthesis polyprenyl glycosylphosphotransferase